MVNERVKVPEQPTHAANIIDNWDGQGDQVFVFAFKHEDQLFSFETGEPLLNYEGDEIVSLWELSESKTKDMPTPNKIKEVLTKATDLVLSRGGDVDTEDGSFATVDEDAIIVLDDAIASAFELDSDDVTVDDLPKIRAAIQAL